MRGRRRRRILAGGGSRHRLGADRRRPRVASLGTAQVGLLVVAGRRGPRPDPVAGEGGGHADAGHPAPRRWRCGRTASTGRNLATAWNDVHIDQYFFNTLIIAAGVVGRPAAGRDDRRVRAVGAAAAVRAASSTALVLATLFVPAVVLLVPLYLTIVRPPLIGTSLINTFWAVWLPAGANAFNVLLVKRFFDNLPREVFEAARVDGAGPFRLFWSIVLPMSRPILGVVSVFAVIAAWKDFLWPMLVLPDPAIQPLSVRLPALQPPTELDVFLAALAISTIIPIALFLVFQRLFLRSAGLGGAVKG